jgi:mono/diheme cytochrome c family protein
MSSASSTAGASSVTIWKWFFFTPGPLVPDAAKSAVLNRGAYLVQALGHCGECHTPRNFLGAPEAEPTASPAPSWARPAVPNITPTRLKKLRRRRTEGHPAGPRPPADGDVLAESMSEVVRNTTSQLTEQDLDAMIAYLRSLPALPDEGK